MPFLNQPCPTFQKKSYAHKHTIEIFVFRALCSHAKFSIFFPKSKSTFGIWTFFFVQNQEPQILFRIFFKKFAILNNKLKIELREPLSI
jgi:hypothetical protein